MKYKQISYVKKPISTLVFGTATPKLFAAVDRSRPDLETCRQEAFALLDAVFAAGINCFDCANHYGEEILGEWIQLRGVREQTVILSKCAHPNEWRDRVTDFDILSDIHDALAKLRTDHVDIYMLHRDNPDVPVSLIVDTMNRLYDEGKIGAFGGSNWTHQRLEQANEYAAKHNLVPFTVSSPNFGLAEQVDNPWVGNCVTLSGPENAEARQWYLDHKMPVFAYSSLARGFFSGAFSSDDREGAKRFLDEAAIKGYYCDRNFERLHRAEALARETNCTVAQIALAWLLNQPVESFLLVSFSNPKHIQSSIDACDITLTPEQVAWLNLESKGNYYET